MNKQQGGQGSFAGLLKAVFWSFFGVRKRKDLERDMTQINPIHLAIAAVLCALVFVGIVVVVVQLVIRGAAA
jgi:hypothetical protein